MHGATHQDFKNRISCQRIEDYVYNALDRNGGTRSSEGIEEMAKGGVIVGAIVVGLAAVLAPGPTGASLRHVAGLVAGARVEAAQKPATTASEINLTATSANVSETRIPVKLRILRWSTDEERGQLVAALAPPPAAPPPAAAAAAPPAGRAEGNPAAPAGDAGGGAARGARGGGRGGGRGGRGDAAAPPNPNAALTAAIGKAPTIGYIWTNDVTGYSIKFAYHAALPGGGERIILATDRRLGEYSSAWKPTAAATVTDYEFTVIEMRLDAKGLGEGKTSLTTKVILDSEAKTLALENYAATIALLHNVKR